MLFKLDDTIEVDRRIEAISGAITRKNIVRIHARSKGSRIIHPVALISASSGWLVLDKLMPDVPIKLNDCGDLNISAKCFD